MKFVNIMKKYIGKPFKKGGLGNGGYDCIGFIYSAQKDLGNEIPDHHGLDVTSTNYYHLYEPKNRKEGYRIMYEWFDSFAKETPITHLLAGDIVVFYQEKTDLLFPSIYIGNGKYITSSVSMGVTAFIPDENQKPMKAWRAKKADGQRKGSKKSND